MNYVDSFNLFGVEAKQNPSIKGSGAPTTSTEGAVGCLYMDIGTGDVYKCTSATDGVYTWKYLGGTPEALTYLEQSLTDDQKVQARENIDAVGNEILDVEYSPNLLDLSSMTESSLLGTNGVLYPGSSYALYVTTAHISCSPGDTIRYQFTYTSGTQSVRYDNTQQPGWTSMYRICGYDADGNFVDGSYASNANVYSVPDGVVSIRVSFRADQLNANQFSENSIIIQADATVVPFYEYGVTISKVLRQDIIPFVVQYTEQTLTPEKQAQARSNIGAASIEDIYSGGHRAQIRQISFLDDNGNPVVFADVYMPSLDQYLTPQGQHRFFVYGLEAHSTNSTAQRVFQSRDGGETWSLFCSVPMNATSGIWYTDFAVDHRTNVIYLLKTTDGSVGKNNVVCTYYKASDGNWYARTNEVSLGEKRWLSNNSFEICNSPDRMKRIAIFGEYGTTMDGTTYSLWMSTDSGTTWTKALEIQGNSNNENNGLIRHWHTVKVDPHTSHLWAASGDNNATESNPEGQARIYRSTDGGVNWELLFCGSQRERTCSFVFEPDCIYYGMDAKHGTDPTFTRIVKIDKTLLEDDITNGRLNTDEETCRTDVASVDCCRSIYGLTRTFYPDGLLVYTQHEPNAVFTSNSYVLEFYDYTTKKLYPVAVFDISSIPKTDYIGFYAGSKYQSLISGVIFAKPTNSMHQNIYGYTEVSKHIKINLTM